MARAAGAAVLLRIEDHDRARCRPEFDAALLEDLAWLGFAPDEGPVRQSRRRRAVRGRARRLRGDGLVYGCDCSRATFEAWADEHGRRWHGPGCPGGCRERGLDGPILRVALGGGTERWMDALVGPCADEVGDRRRPARSATATGTGRTGSSVVVDDLRQGIDLVVRGRDLLAATPAQIRLGRLLGRETPPTFAHHPLVRRPTAGSCRRPTATRRSASCARPAGRRRSSSARRRPRSG